MNEERPVCGIEHVNSRYALQRVQDLVEMLHAGRFHGDVSNLAGWFGLYELNTAGDAAYAADRADG